MADVWGARRLFLVALALFTIGSLLAGRAQTIDELIAGRIVQGLGGGILVPVGTAAASHLFEGHARPRALGVIGALTFLGMAAGPFVGAAILGGLNVEGALESVGAAPGSALHALFAPSWRWVFYINVPIGICALLVAWAASAGWETPRRSGGVDVVGAIIWTIALGGGLVAVTLLGSPDVGGLDPLLASAALAAVAVVGDDPHDRPRLPPAGPVHRPAPVQEPDVRVGGARLAADRLRVRDRDRRRGGVRRSRPLRRPRAAAGRAGLARRRDGRRGARLGVRGPLPVAAARDARRAARVGRGAALDVALDAGRRARRGRARAGGLRGRLRADRDAALDGRGRDGGPGVVRDGAARSSRSPG